MTGLFTEYGEQIPVTFVDGEAARFLAGGPGQAPEGPRRLVLSVTPSVRRFCSHVHKLLE